MSMVRTMLFSSARASPPVHLLEDTREANYGCYATIEGSIGSGHGR